MMIKTIFLNLCDASRTTYRLAVAVSATVLLASSASSEEPRYLSQAEALGLITTVNLHVADQVSDMCWTNASSSKAKIRLLFEQNDILVEKEDLAFLSTAGRRVVISALGYRSADGLCVVTADFDVGHWASAIIGGYDDQPKYSVSGLVRSFERAAIFSAPDNTNTQLQDFFEASASDFLADVLAARRSTAVQDLKKTYPNFGRHLLTQTEWENLSPNAPSSE